MLGLYFPPVLNMNPLPPPQTIISLPVQTAVCPDRFSGALVVVVAVHVSSVHRGPSALAIFEHVAKLPTFVATDMVRSLSVCRRPETARFGCCTDKSAIKRAANTGLAKHSAMTAGFISKSAKQFPQNFRLFCMPGHAVHFRLRCSAVIGSRQ